MNHITILLTCIMIMLFILLQTQLKLSSHIGEVKREQASLELKLAGLNKKYNDLHYKFNRHIHNECHDTEQLKIKLDELRTIVIGDDGKIEVAEKKSPLSCAMSE